MQVYIVAAGYDDRSYGSPASTETLEKDGGNAWQVVANLPSGRRAGVSGVGLYNGRFIVTG